jgi:hypothetical protein
MKKGFYFTLLLFPFLFSECSKAKESSSDALMEALQWMPDSARYIAFDNWAQITEDFGFDKKTYWSKSWIPQKTDTGWAKNDPKFQQDNFAPYGNADSSCTALGFDYPEIQWHAETDLRTQVIKLQDNFSRTPFDQFIKTNDYKPEVYKGFSIYNDTNGFEDFEKKNILWAEHIYRSMCYVPEENVLITAIFDEEIKKLIDIHLSKKRMGNNNGMNKIAEIYKNAESVFLSYNGNLAAHPFDMGGRTDSLQREELKKTYVEGMSINLSEYGQLNHPVLSVLGEEKDGKGISVLKFNSQGEATLDEPIRLRILQNGRSFIDKRKLSNIFFKSEAVTNDDLIIFKWETTPVFNTVWEHFVTNDLPWMVYPGW